MGIEGGSKKASQAAESVKDLAKYLKFTGPSSLNIDDVCDRQKAMNYVDLLRKLGVGPSGQVNKLHTIITAINWQISKLSDTSPTPYEKDKLHKATVCRDKLQAVKKSIGKEKVWFNLQLNKQSCVELLSI